MSSNVQHLAPSDSPFARFDPRWKLLAIVASAGMIVAMRSAPVLGAALAVTLILAVITRVPGRWFRSRIAISAVALSPFLVILPLTVDRGGPSFEIAGVRLSVEGFIAAGALIAKTAAIVGLMLILLASAPLHETLRAAQRLHVPGLFVQLAQMSYRYLFLLLDELNRIRVALRVRGFRNRMSRHGYHTVGRIAGTLLVRGAERADRVAQAMRCRGFDGTFRGIDAFRMTFKDVLAFTAIALTYATLLVWDVIT
jgi:cobalt/nickel transport system permease protein